MMFNFVLVDGIHVVRGIRLATVSPDVTMALWQARSELLARAITAACVQSEMMEIFAQYPRGIPETFFHASCDFGTSWLSPINSITLA